MVSLLGIVILVWGICFVFGYLDPQGSGGGPLTAQDKKRLLEPLEAASALVQDGFAWGGPRNESSTNYLERNSMFSTGLLGSF